MDLTLEAMVGIVALLVALPPTILVITRWIQRRRHRRQRETRRRGRRTLHCIVEDSTGLTLTTDRIFSNHQVAYYYDEFGSQCDAEFYF